MKKHAPRLYDPFEIILSTVFGLSGLLQFFVGPSPGSSSTLLPTPFRLTWLALMVFGCALTVFGALIPRVWGYLVERIGLQAAGWSLVIWGVSVMYVQIQRGGFTPQMIAGGPLILLLGVAFLWKRRQIKRVLDAQPKVNHNE